MSEQPELSIPGFEILGKIGEGGMGAVYQARQLSLDRLVAIKVLPKAFSENLEYVEHFKREARAEAILKHHNIVQIYQAGISEGKHYLVMEHVSGYSVAELLERKGKLSEEDCLHIAESVARALEYAWEKARIIHGDIKPDNILIDEDGTVKLGDFLATSLAAGIAQPAPFSDSILGTPQFMSPEQVLGEERLDGRADIYALGAVLYHLLSGKLPFSGAGEKDQVRRQLTGYLDDIQSLSPEVSAPMTGLVAKMLVRDLDSRPQTWAAVLEDIERVRKKKMPGAPLPAPGASAMKWTPQTVIPQAPHKKAFKMRKPTTGSRPAVATAGEEPESDPTPKEKTEPLKNKIVSLVQSLVILAFFVGVLMYYLRSGKKSESEPADIETAESPQSIAGPGGPPSETGEYPAAPAGTPSWPGAQVEAGGSAIPAIPEEAEFAAPGAAPVEDPATLLRGLDLEAFVSLQQQVMGYSKKRNFGAALQLIDGWLHDVPAQSYVEQAQTERSRITSAQEVLASLEAGKSALKGAPMNITDKITGEITDIRGGKILVRRKLDTGAAVHEMELLSLTDADLGRFLKLADPDQAARHLAVWLISKGSLQQLPALMEEMRNAGQDPADLNAWTTDWQQASLNARAYRALEEIEGLIESGQLEKARTRLDEAGAYFAASDVFQWAATRKISELEQQLVPQAVPAVAPPIPPPAEIEKKESGAEVEEEIEENTTGFSFDAENENRVTIPELLEQYVVLDGKIIRLRFKARGAIEQLSETSFRTSLAEDQYSVPVEFPAEAYKWIHAIPESWDTRSPRRNVFARVDATRRTLQLIGRVRRVAPGSQTAEYSW